MSFTILDRKDDEIAPLPLLLVDVRWPTGETLHVSSHVLPIAYGGITYQPRILNQQIASQAILSQEGLTSTPSVTQMLEDADKSLWRDTELARGWKGATVTAFFVFYDPISNSYSTDAYTKFVGIANPANADDGSLTINAESRMKMSLIQLPTTRISRTCPWLFPQTPAQRQAAADDPQSDFYRCGFSCDATGSNARGNYQSGIAWASAPGTPPTSCDKTAKGCADRGMYSKDLNNRATGRFGGIQWAPPGTYYVRSYGGKWEQLFNQDNQAKYNDFVPFGYGLIFIDPAPALDVAPDGNYTHSEILLGEMRVWDIQLVLVNDEQLPHTFDDTRIATPPGVFDRAGALKIGFWLCVNDGQRDGLACQDNMYNGKGDPMGSRAVIETVAVNNIASAASAPTVKVLAKCGQVRVYTDPTTFTYVYSNNPAWVLLDILSRRSWLPADVDIASFITAAALYDTSISYVTISGGTGSHAAYACNIYVRSRRSLTDITRGILNGCGSYLTQDWQGGGKLQLWHEGTICSDQPSPIPGSNDNVAIPGLNLDGTTGVGYSAYHFDETTILREGNKTTVTLAQAPLSQTPNVEGFEFYNEENRYSRDVATLADTEDIALMWQQAGTAQFDGLTNYDQAYRMLARMVARSYRGNPRNDAVGNPIGDSKGTLAFTFKTTFRAIHLRVGHIVTYSSKQYNLVRQLFRVASIQPSVDFRQLTVTILWHNDIWYVWTFGQDGQPTYSSPFRNATQRTPQIWNPSAIFHPPHDSMFPGAPGATTGAAGFRVVVFYESAADGSAIAHAKITGLALLNQLNTLQPPYLPIQGTTATTGGTIKGGRNVYVAIAARGLGVLPSSATSPGPLSEVCRIAVGPGADTNTVTVGSIQWTSTTGVTDGIVYAGYEQNNLIPQTSISTGAASITLTAINIYPGGNPPDAIADHIEFYYKRISLAGVWVAQVVSVTATTITVALPNGTTFGVNQWAGYDVSAYSLDAGLDAPCCNFRLASNDAVGVLTLASGTPDPTTDVSGSMSGSLAAGNWVVCRALPTIGTDGTGNYVQDVNFTNAFALTGLVASALKGQLLRITKGTGAGTKYGVSDNATSKIYIDGPWIVVPDSTSRFIVEDGSWSPAAKGSATLNADSIAQFETIIDLPNNVGQSYLIAGVSETSDGTDSPIDNAPMREILVVGAPGDGSTQSAINITMDGMLGAAIDIGRRIALQQTATVKAIRLQLKQPSLGADIQVSLYAKSGTTTVWGPYTVALPSGQTSGFASPTVIAGIADIPANASVRADILAYTTGLTFPGADLAIAIYL